MCASFPLAESLAGVYAVIKGDIIRQTAQLEITEENTLQIIGFRFSAAIQNLKFKIHNFYTDTLTREPVIKKQKAQRAFALFAVTIKNFWISTIFRAYFFIISLFICIYNYFLRL